MKFVFLSNYFNHHQKSFCEHLYKKLGQDFVFIATTVMREERRKLGYGENDFPEYVLLSYLNRENEELADRYIAEADIVVVGSAPEAMLKSRKKAGKIILRYSERLLKNGFEPWKYPIRFQRWHKNNPKGLPIYMLCASAYTSADYAKFGLFKGKTYKWGYFPECKKYDDLTGLISNKEKNRIMWCGRFLDWKHPDDALVVARKLKEQKYDFHMDIIGTGEMEDSLKQYVEIHELKDVVSLLDPMKPEKIREKMEKAGIYLFTSDKKEGWGAVLNEAMNSACAVVASHAIGSVPYLLKNHENGLIYESGNTDMLYGCVKYLLDNPEEQIRLDIAAYHTITAEWNAEVAAERFVNLAEHILMEEKDIDLYASGPCSKAETIKDNWFKE